MPSKLKLRMLNRVALVDRGANPKAHVVLFKSEGGVGIPASLRDRKLAGPLGERLEELLSEVGKIAPDMSPEETSSHLTSAHGVATGNTDNPRKLFAAHNQAHSEKKFKDGKAHDHAQKTVEEEYEALRKRDIPTSKRVELAKKGWAIPVRNDKGEIVDGRYPIETVGDLENAVSASGRGTGLTPEIVNHIMKNARRLGRADLIPDKWKASKADDGITLEDLSKIGRKISRARLQRLTQARDEINTILSEAEVVEEPGKEDKVTEKHDELKRPEDWKFDELPENVRQYIEGVEAKAKEAPATKKDDEPEEDVLKGLDPAVADVVRKAQQDAAAARKEASELRIEKANSEWTEKVAKFDHLGLEPEKLGPQLRVLSEQEDGKAAVDAVMEKLAAANEQMDKAALFSEFGGGGQVFGADSAYAKLETMAKARFEAIKKTADGAAYTIEQAFTDVTADPANAEIVQAYDAERKEANR